MIHLIGNKHSGHGPDGRRLYFKGGGSGGQVKYDNLERLYDEQAASARLLRGIAEQNLPGATQAYVGNVQNVLAPDYASRQAGMAGADMAGANAMERAATERNIAVVKRMMAYARSVPDTWSAHQKLADTPKGWAIHALVLDIDVGPLLQTHKLLTSVIFARNKGYTRPLTAAELEMMNLTGDGTGFDMVTMPQAMRERVPTANFFQRRGYERNPVAIRHNTVAKLLAVTNARMDSNSAKPGARELAAAF